ncbi:hypothetical protein Slin14017_G128470 [Septoria linicola]|nr:hypothetical protein Slin14017_G128470 [Septoria linicola]
MLISPLHCYFCGANKLYWHPTADSFICSNCIARFSRLDSGSNSRVDVAADTDDLEAMASMEDDTYSQEATTLTREDEAATETRTAGLVESQAHQEDVPDGRCAISAPPSSSAALSDHKSGVQGQSYSAAICEGCGTLCPACNSPSAQGQPQRPPRSSAFSAPLTVDTFPVPGHDPDSAGEAAHFAATYSTMQSPGRVVSSSLLIGGPSGSAYYPLATFSHDSDDDAPCDDEDRDLQWRPQPHDLSWNTSGLPRGKYNVSQA